MQKRCYRTGCKEMTPMPRKKVITPSDIESVSENLINMMPLLSKHLLQSDAIRNEHGISLSQMQVLSMLAETGPMSMS